MQHHILKENITRLESFLQDTSNKLNKNERAELAGIINGFKDNVDKPDRNELVQLTLALFKLIASGADLFKHFL